MNTTAVARRRSPVVLATIVVTALLVGIGAAWLLRPNPTGPTVLHAGTADHTVVVTVENPRTGPTGIAVEISDRSGAPVSRAAVDISAVMPSMGHTAPAVHATATSGGHYHADGVDLAMAGQWELQLSIDGVDRLMLPIIVGG